MKILGTGLDGLVGSRIVELLSSKYQFENNSISTGLDITDRDAVLEKIKTSNAQVVLHLAAKTDVDGCEKDKALAKDGEAWKINVEGTRNVVDACDESGKKLIYISTDFVFDGENPPSLGYDENDSPNPLNWYAKTKYEGEKLVQGSKCPWTIIRIAYPYRLSFVKNDFVRAILKRLETGMTVFAVSDHIFTPTFIDDIAFAINMLIRKEERGLFHVVGSQHLSPYEAALMIADAFSFDRKNIIKTTRSEYFKQRAYRPFKLVLKNDKIENLGIKMRTLKEGLRELKKQISNF